MKAYLTLILVLIFSIIGCERTTTSSENYGLSTSSYKAPNAGEVKLDIISKTNTLNDETGGYKDSGHYSIIYQAKSKKGDLPIEGLDSDEFYTVYENGEREDETVFRVVQDPKSVSNKILLLLDFSGSIINDCNQADASTNPSNLCYQIVNSSQKFIDKVLSKNQSMSIYYFNSQKIILPLSDNANTTADASLLKSSLSKLYDPTWREDHLKGYNGTNLYGAVVDAVEVVRRWFPEQYDKESQTDMANRKRYDFATIVVFTDGHDNANLTSQSKAVSKIDKFSKNYYYYAIGLGRDVDDDALKNIGKDGYFKAYQTDKLDNEFENLGEKISNFANSFYRLDFCPVSKNSLMLKLKLDDDRGFYGESEQKIDLINKDFRCDL